MKFVADRTLGKLARKLRVLGFDSIYWRGGDLSEAARAARSEGGMLLTRSRRAVEGNEDLQVLVVEANDPREQVREVLSRLKLKPSAGQFFSRCLLCNEPLQPIAKGEAEGKVPDFIYRSHGSFHVCPRCRRIYWPGTHFARMKEELAGMMDEG